MIQPNISALSAKEARAPAETSQLDLGQDVAERLRNNPTPFNLAIENSPSILDRFFGNQSQTGTTEAAGPQVVNQVLFAQPGDLPAPVDTGLDYYEQRAADFVERNPGVEPPDYYIEYGDKYAERFASLDDTDLSPEGLAWRDRTLEALQVAIEDKRREDPEGFAELERDPDAFREFAYGTHPDAYVDSGLFDLSAQDLTVIGATPDIGDVLTRDGIGQTLVTLGKLRPADLVDIGAQTVVQTARDLPNPGIRQAERIVDRIRNQDINFPDFSVPDFSLPDIDVPRIGLPDINLPDINVPDIDVPDIDIPDIKVPDVWPFS